VALPKGHKAGEACVELCRYRLRRRVGVVSFCYGVAKLLRRIHRSARSVEGLTALVPRHEPAFVGVPHTRPSGRCRPQI